MVVFHQDTDLRYTWIYNPALGYDAPEVIGRRDRDLFEFAEDAEITEAIKQRVMLTGRGEREEVRIRHEGLDRFYDLVIEPLRDSKSRIAGVVCAALEVTNQKEAMRSQEVMIQELSHRVKNSLTIVQALAQQTFKGANVSADIQRKFEDRLLALGAAHDILLSAAAGPVSLEDITRDAIRICGLAADRVDRSGPEGLSRPPRLPRSSWRSMSSARMP